MRLQHRLFYSEIDHKTKKWKTIFWEQKTYTHVSYPRNIIEFKKYLNDCKGSEQN